MPPLPDAIILMLAPLAPPFSPRVWGHAPGLLLGAIVAPKARTVTAALGVMGWATERRFTTYHRGLNRATWSTRQAGRILWDLRITWLMPAGATLVLGADDTVERRSGQKIRAKGCDREAGRSSKKPVLRCFGLNWGSMRLLVPVPWSQRVWALPFFTTLARPADQHGQPRHQTRSDGLRHMLNQVRRGRPGRQLGVVVDGGFAAVSLALACVTHQVGRGSRLRWAAALSHPPGLQPPGKRGPKPSKGQRQRRWQAWAERSKPPWEDVAVVWAGGQRQQLWGVSHTARWYRRGLPPVAIRSVLVCTPEGKLRMDAFFCTDLQATPAQILEWVVRRWSVEVTVEETRTHLGVETQRPGSDRAIARTTPVLLALFALVTLVTLRLRQDGPIPVQATAWYHKAEPTVADGLALVRRPLCCVRYVVNSAPEAAFRQFPREAFELLLYGCLFAA